jgi:hypothetical protein
MSDVRPVMMNVIDKGEMEDLLRHVLYTTKIDAAEMFLKIRPGDYRKLALFVVSTSALTFSSLILITAAIEKNKGKISSWTSKSKEKAEQKVEQVKSKYEKTNEDPNVV